MENIEANYSILKSEHLGGLVRLYKTIFGKRVQESYFEIKYGLLLPNQIQFSTVILNGEEVIGFMGALPQQFKEGNKSIQTLHLGDFFLDKEYRGYDFFNKAYLHSLSIANTNKVDYLYAFQSDQTFKICERLGWHEEIGFKRFHIKALPSFFASFSSKLGLEKQSRRRLEKYIKPFIIEMNPSVFDLGKEWSMHCSEEFIKMKEYQPYYLIQIGGVTIWMKYEYRLSIGFMHMDETVDVKSMINTLQRIARKCLIAEVVIHLHPNSKEATILSESLEPFDSFQVSSLALKQDVPMFSFFDLHLMYGDVF